MATHTKFAAAALLAAGMALVGPVRADEAAAGAGSTAAVSSDDAFSFFLQEAEVVTASRRAQKKSDSPVAIDVITKEDIAKSGALNIWDLLRFRVGLDVAEATSIEGNAVQLNVRGLPGEFSQSLQVLIDGRSVVSGTNNGIFWRNLPVALADIERIEIVRGPNSALFGANAGQGVINIITRKPSDGLKGSYRAEAGQHGLFNVGAAGEFGTPTSAWRLSYNEHRQGSNPQPNGDESVDMSSTRVDTRLNARGDLRLWEGGEAELFGGISQRDYRIPNPASFTNPAPAGEHGSDAESYSMLRLTQAVGEHDLELAVSTKDINSAYAGAAVKESVQDADLLARINLLDGKSVSTLGGSLRYIRSESGFLFNYNGLGDGGDVENNRQGRAYAGETLNAADWLTVALAGSLETSDLGGQWPAYQGAVILKPLDGHTLRISGSRSPSMPSLQNSRSDIMILFGAAPLPGGPAGPGFYPVGIVAKGVAVHPAQVSSYEATWTSSLLDRRVVAEVTGFQMEIDGQITLDAKPGPYIDGAPFFLGDFAPLGGGAWAWTAAGQYVEYANTTNLVLRGVETVLTFKPVDGTTIQLNHTYEDVYYQNPNDPNDPFNNGVTPWNKVNLLASTELPWGLNVAGQLGWVGEHIAYLGSRGLRAQLPDQAKLDLRLGWKPVKDVEIFGAALNLDHALRTEGLDGTAQPQMYYGGLNLAFGGK